MRARGRGKEREREREDKRERGGERDGERRARGKGREKERYRVINFTYMLNVGCWKTIRHERDIMRKRVSTRERDMDRKDRDR